MTNQAMKPSDFDWVTARAQCSPLSMCAQLKADIEKNVESMRSLSKARGSEIPIAAFDNGQSFGVSRRTYVGEIGVIFTLRNEEIRVSSKEVKVDFVATLTLSDDGECRLLVDGKELDRWQVLRRALEPLFFVAEP